MQRLDNGLQSVLRQDPDKFVLKMGSQSWTASEVSSRIASCGADLDRLGLNPGDCLWLMLPNGPEFIAILLAANQRDIVVVPLNPLAAPAECVAYAEVSPPHLIVIDDMAREETSASIAEWNGDRIALCDGHLAGWRFDQGAVSQSTSEDGPSLVLFTSGTTGMPKGVPLTAFGLMENARDSAHALDLRYDDDVLCPLPLFHVFGLVVGLLAPWQVGASVRISPRFDPVDTTETLMREASVLLCVPAMAAAVLSASADGSDIEQPSKLRLAAMGGAAMERELAQRFERRFGVMPVQGYGMTETCGVISLPSPADPSLSCGFPLDSIEVEVRHQERFVDSADSRRELWVRGPQVISHYLGNAGASESFADGWFNTGDIGKITSTGEIELLGRSKDVILRGGLNVYPQEVEAALVLHPKIVQAAVVGRPDPVLGEEVAAFIVTNDHVDEEEVINFSRSKLALYKYPRQVTEVKSLPITPAGKVQRHLLMGDAS